MSRLHFRLGVAAILSAAAHAAMLGGSWLLPPELPPAPVLSARLDPAQPPVDTSTPVATVARQARIAAAAALPVLIPESAVALPSASEALSGEPHAHAVAQNPAPEPVVVASAIPTALPAPELPSLPDFPRTGQITYQLTLGPDQTPVGRTTQTWVFDGLQYRLGSESESTGLIELFRPHRYRYLSQGTLSASGLRPERFLASVQRGSRSDESSAVFNWTERRIRLGRLPQLSTVELPDGSQDIISFMYQLALSPPPPGRFRLPFTRGARLDMASFDVLPEEHIDTPLGRLRTLPVVQVREHEQESLALWLALDYRNLPVRIRFFSRDGSLNGEQLVSEIRVGNP